MDRPNLKSLIVKYNEAIPEKEGEQPLAQLIYDYRKALKALHEGVRSSK